MLKESVSNNNLTRVSRVKEIMGWTKDEQREILVWATDEIPNLHTLMRREIERRRKEASEVGVTRAR